MRYERRIQNLIESELRKHLSFTFTMAGNLTDPSSRIFRRGDLVRFHVRVSNDADLPFEKVSGFLSATQSAVFRTTRFMVRDLQPWQEKKIATVDVLIRAMPREGAHYDWIAKLTVVATVDLSRVVIRESERMLAFGSCLRDTPQRWQRRSIPLSAPPPLPE
jgi:hypothetical protein